ncbi:PREDICTED: probable root meristem growth factor 8 isoform X3 [Populus euphratica]|uniref:Probable root meristem growth factor 8 isoform X3 n=1 Tax=Populus euphratica TaxID=75702 RepID=A0AAJ6TEJ9_POPEU|nr:PREDICTED: probable root meristem growth factor 8 isoform X3 [Populus euphratica]
MDLMAIVTVLCICLSVLLVTPSAAMQVHEKQSSHQHDAGDRIKFSGVPTLPRKLRVLLDQEAAVKSYAARSSTSLNKQKGDNAPAGKAYHKGQNGVHGGRPAGTWREWVEGTDTSHFFTMDYSRVRRRRPIHNKSLPVGP